MARRRFFVDAVQSGRARITGPDAHHLTRVLRVEAGQHFEISDNQNVYLAEVESARKDLVTFVVEERLVVVEPTVRTTLLASLLRFERFELIIEKATELGVERSSRSRRNAPRRACGRPLRSAWCDGTASREKRASNRGARDCRRSATRRRSACPS